MGNTDHGIWYPDDYQMAADMPVILRQNADSIEAALDAQDGLVAGVVTVPVGSIVAYGGATAPVGWHLCDGSAHGSTALQAVLGSANAPDLRARFIVGAGSGYALKATGGADQVTLAADQSGVAPHAHAASAGNASGDHTHAFTTGGMSANASHAHTASTGSAGSHAHGSPYRSNITRLGDEIAGNDFAYLSQTVANEVLPTDGAHTHAVTVASASTAHTHSGTTGGQSGTHQHPVTVANADAAPAAQAHENRPPFYALTYIIRK